MKIFKNLIRERKGFTMMEAITVIVIVAVLTAAAVPGFMRGLRSARFEAIVSATVIALEKARNQALASELSNPSTAMENKIPPGGYGVFIDFTSDTDPTNQEVVLFIDDWNQPDGPGPVKIDYDDVTDRMMPDGIYTDSGDTELLTIAVNTPEYIQIESLSGTRLDDANPWASATGNTVTVIFKPPYAETTIVGDDGTGTAYTDLQNFEVMFKLATDDIYRKIKLNRVTTTPQVLKCDNTGADCK